MTLININLTVPGEDSPGSPVFVFYDNGDWEVTFADEVDAIKNSAPNFLMALHAYEVVNDACEFFEMSAEDEFDGAVVLFLNENVTEKAPNEPVLMLYEGECYNMLERGDAEFEMSADNTALNFAPLVDLIDDLKDFVEKNRFEIFKRGFDDGHNDEDENER